MTTLTIQTERPDDAGCTPLMYAVTAREPERVRKLLERVNVNEKDLGGKSALHHAAMSGQAGMVKALLQAKADANLRDNGGATALIYAAMCGYEDVVRVLLRHHADPRCADRHGRTAAQAAMRSGFGRIAQILR